MSLFTGTLPQAWVIWITDLFVCLCASLGQIVSATFDEGVHLTVHTETRQKKKILWYTLFLLSCSFSPNQFLFLYQNCQRSFRWSCPGGNGNCARGDSNFHVDSLDCTPAVDFFDSVGLLWSHPAALISPHAPTCTYTHERLHIRAHTHTSFLPHRSWHICDTLVWEFEQCARHWQCVQRLLL